MALELRALPSCRLKAFSYQCYALKSKDWSLFQALERENDATCYARYSLEVLMSEEVIYTANGCHTSGPQPTPKERL